MLIEAGHFALALSLGVSLVQGIVPLWGTRANDPVLMGVAGPAALASFGCLAFAFAALAYAALTDGLSVPNVVGNSHSPRPLIYKVSGVWGHHEGSLLLWILTLTLFGAVVALAPNPARASLCAGALAVQAAISFAFL